MPTPSPEEAVSALHSEQGRPAAFFGNECESFLQAVPDIVYVMDLEGRLVHWNKRFEDVTGLGRAELTGKNCLEFFPPDEQELHKESIKRKLAGYDEVESHLITKGGELRVYHWSGAALHDDKGQVVGVIGTGRDITERKELENRVQAQNRRLLELDRLKNTFVSAVSHELRTPLTSIRGYVEFLEDRIGGPLSEDQSEFVHQIGIGARRLARLVDDLLDFARLEAGNFKLTLSQSDVSEAIAEAIESLQPQAKAAHVRLEMHQPEEATIACVDTQRLEQVVINLVHNALKFTPAGGRVDVTLTDADGQLRVEVKDTGVGIAQQHLSKLFAKFYQVGGESGAHLRGVGLGLFISKSLVEAHGGAIGVDSAPGRGTTFWFTLPKRDC